MPATTPFDVTLESTVDAFGSRTLSVILTGMGTDGTRGAGLVKAAGGTVLAESQETAIIYGMPRSVVEAGHADQEVRLEKIAGEIVNLCTVEGAKDN